MFGKQLVLKFTLLFVMLNASTSYARDVYISQNRVNNAVRAAFPNNATARFPGDCLSCHDNPPNLPAVGFGRDFFNRQQVLFPAVNGALTQAQIQTLVSDNTFGNLDSDTDTFNNRLEFTSGTDPGNRNSRPGGPTTTTTTRLPATPRPTPSGTPGDVNKFTGANANSNDNYLNSSGCGNKSSLLQKPSQVSFSTAAASVAHIILPLLLAFYIRRKND